ncbi:MAG TPA: hypothetical protein DCQ04_04285 [Actinobacteria bacterium]|jgi:Tfp pilus assembly protein FimV|nr:hypothetical protein [Actinomycetota bacterium]
MHATSSFDQLFALTLSAIFTAYLLRCFAGALLFACAQLPTRWSSQIRRYSWRVTPQLARRLAILLVGITGAGVVSTPAFAASAPDLDRGIPQQSVARTDGPVAPMPEQTETARLTQRAGRAKVRVQVGDCLWKLAERQLDATASARSVDRQWRQWYRTNKGRIGDNPNRLRTGMWLSVPAIQVGSGASSDASHGGGK